MTKKIEGIVKRLQWEYTLFMTEINVNSRRTSQRRWELFWLFFGIFDRIGTIIYIVLARILPYFIILVFHTFRNVTSLLRFALNTAIIWGAVLLILWPFWEEGLFSNWKIAAVGAIAFIILYKLIALYAKVAPTDPRKKKSLINEDGSYGWTSNPINPYQASGNDERDRVEKEFLEECNRYRHHGLKPWEHCNPSDSNEEKLRFLRDFNDTSHPWA